MVIYGKGVDKMSMMHNIHVIMRGSIVTKVICINTSEFESCSWEQIWYSEIFHVQNMYNKLT